MSLDVPVIVDESSRIKTILIIVTIFAILIAVAAYLYTNHLIPRFYIIATKSMVPTLNPGDVVIIRKVSPSKIRVGDIIAYDAITYNPGTGPNIRTPIIIVHRVIRIINVDGMLYFKTKGDNNPEPDPWYVPAGAVLGIAEKVISLGKFGLLLISPIGKIIVMLLITFIILAIYYSYTQAKSRRIIV